MGGSRIARCSRGLFRLIGLGSLVWLSAFAPCAEAGGLRRRQAPPTPPAAVPTVVCVPTARPLPATLGSGFTRTPYLMVRGNYPAGGGYTPLNQDGDISLATYGPLSALRMTSAPVATYTRGYDGRTVVVPGTSFSTPNQPGLTPVVYPTQATPFSGFRTTTVPPWWPNSLNWIDQN